MPLDWAHFNVSKPYWDSFPIPSMLSCVYIEDHFEPYDFSLLGTTFDITNSSDFLISQNVRVVQPTYIPLLFQMKIYMILNEAVFIYGKKGSGKSCFIDCIFRDNPNIIPIFVPISSMSTEEVLFDFITQKFSFLDNIGSLIDIPRTALIFNNIQPDNLYAIESIRSLLTKKKDILGLSHVIVTSEVIEGFSPRFLSVFSFIHISEQTEYTKKYIYSTVAKSLNISDEYVKVSQHFIHKFGDNFHFMQLLDCASISKHKNAIMKQATPQLIKLLLAELRFLFAHRICNDDFKQLKVLFNSLYLNLEVQTYFNEIMRGNSLQYPEYDKEDKKTIIYEHHLVSLFREELEFLLHMNNMPINLKHDMYMFSPIIYDFILLSRSVFLPGGSAVLKSSFSGVGRKTLVRFLATSREYLYHDIQHKHNLEKLKQELCHFVKKILLQHTEAILLVRFEELSQYNNELVSNLFSLHDPSILFQSSEYKTFLGRFSETLSTRKNDYEMHIEACKVLHEKLHFMFCVSHDASAFRIPILSFGENPINYIRQCSDEYLDKQEFKESIKDKTKVCQVFVQIYTLIASRTPLTMFFDFMRNFMTLYTREYEYIQKTNDLMKNALNFIMTIDTEITTVESEIKKLAQDSEGKKHFFSEKISFIDSKKISIKNRLEKIGYEETLKKQEIYEIEQDLEKLKTDSVNSIRNAALALNKLSSAPQKLNSYYGNRSFVRLFELLAFWLGDPPKFDPYGRHIAEDSLLKQTIEKRGAVREMGTNEEKIARQVEAMYDDYNQESTYLTQLADYCIEMSIASKTQKQLDQKQETLTKNKKELSVVLENFCIEKESILQILTDIEEERKTLEKEQVEYEQKERDHKDCISKRNDMDDLVLRIHDLEGIWMDKISAINKTINKSLGNIILVTFFMTYGGMHFELLDEVVSVLQQCDIEKDEDKSTVEIIGQQLGLCDSNKDLKISDLGVPMRYKIFAQLVFHSKRVPLLADKSGYIEEVIYKTIPKPEQITCSIVSTDLIDTVLEAAEKGYIMIIYDVSELTTQLELILDFVRSGDGKTPTVLGKREVIIDAEFRLVLCTACGMADIPQSLISVVNPIDFDKYKNEVVTEIFNRLFTIRYNPQTVSDLVDPVKTLVDQSIQMRKLENELLMIMSDIKITQKEDPSYNFVDDHETISALVRTKSQFLFALFESNSPKTQRKDISTLKLYKQQIAIAESIWVTLSSIMPSVSPLYCFSLRSYIKNIEEVLKESDEPTVLTKKIISMIERMVIPSLSIQDGMFFMLVSSFLFSQQDASTKYDDISVIMKHITSEYDAKCRRTITDNNGNETFERLKFVNIIDLFKLSEFLIREYFDNYFDNTFEEDKIPEGNVIIINQNRTSIERYSNDLNGYESFSLGANAESLTKAKTSLIRSRKSGGTLVFYYDTPDKLCAEFIVDIVDSLSKNMIHPTFKVIISCSTLEYLPCSIFKVAKVISTREPFSVRSTMSSLSSCFNNNKTGLSYAISMFFALTKFKGFIKPNGITDSSFITISSIMKLISRIMNTRPTIQEAKRTIRTYIESKFSNPKDTEKAIMYMNSVLIPTICEAEFSFSKSVTSTAWIIPKTQDDVTDILSRLPIFPPLDALKVNKNACYSYYQWSISRWIAKPFTSILKYVEIDAIAKLNSISVTVPTKISCMDMRDNPLSLLCQREVEIYNNTIDVIKKAVFKPSTDAKIAVYNDMAPTEWTETLKIEVKLRIASFFKVMAMRKEFIDTCLKGNFPKKINVVSVSNVRYVIDCFMNTWFNDFVGEPILEMEPTKEKTLALDGIELCGWGFDVRTKMLVRPSKNNVIAVKLPTAYLKKKSDINGSIASVPLCKDCFGGNIIDGKLDNFICNMVIKGDLQKEAMIMNGVTAVLQQASAFEE